MRYTTLAIAGIIASAAALALLAGFATTQSPLNSFYATGTAEAVSEPIDVVSKLNTNIAPAAGAQGSEDMGFVLVPVRADVNDVKLLVKIANAAQLRPYFKYLQLQITSAFNTNESAIGNYSEIKAVLSLQKPKAVIILDAEDLFNIAKLNETAASIPANVTFWVPGSPSDKIEIGNATGSWQITKSGVFNGMGNDATFAVLTVKAFYEAREGMLFDSLPVILNFQVLQVG
ncbi:hypothetical protein [Pyrodictium abyssi]|uniref:Uncharacterized protein n=1 Tax=Pyrodictium abyssi TaxID=54256 RepID=A0ABN6ZLM2_9CREN|nr:hypothetical protein PABY_06990 [Pyrodictium abyssi]